MLKDTVRPYVATDNRPNDQEWVCLEFDLPPNSVLPFGPTSGPITSVTVMTDREAKA